MSNHSISEAIILCGGAGTRLRSIVNDRPKPMAEVLGKPFLELLIEYLQSQGIKHIFLSTGYQSSYIEEWVNSCAFNVGIRISKENSPLGTGGAVKKATKFIKSSSFLVLNGDSFTAFSISEMLDCHIKNNANITIGVNKVPDIQRYGQVTFDQNNNVTSFQEKGANNGTGYINAGVYIFKSSIIETFQNESFSLEKEFFPHFLSNKFFCVPSESPFIDIGTPESYQHAPKFLESLNL